LKLGEISYSLSNSLFVVFTDHIIIIKNLTLMITAFLRVTPCSVVEICQIFDGTRSFQLEGTLKLKVMRFSETIVNFFQAAWRYISENGRSSSIP
jgi:hypothetical protein